MTEEGSPTVTVTVNGARRAAVSGTTVADLVDELTGAASARGVAVAVNDAVVPRSAWAGTPLRDGDVVEVLTAVQGG